MISITKLDMYNNLKIKNLLIFLFRFLILNSFILFAPVLSELNLENKNKNFIDSEYLRPVNENDFYILGPGDKFKIKIYDNTFLNDNFFSTDEASFFDVSIDGEGYASLPRLNKIYVSGLTIEELSTLLNKEYLQIVKDPNVIIRMMAYRPVKIYIEGEVDFPGIYVLNNQNRELKKKNILNLEKDIFPKGMSPTIGPSNIEDNIFFPTLIDAIRTSQGFTLNADLKKIEVIRKNSITNGGGRIKAVADLSKVINMTDYSQNIRLMDGDVITVKRTYEPILSQISKIIKSNINPRFINVLISGRVESPGTIQVNNGGTLLDALKIGGGTKVLKGKIVFLRYKSDGSVDRRKFKLNKKAKIGSFENPYLKNGDIIAVEKSLLNKTNEVVSEVTSPIKGILSSVIFYQAIVD